MVQWELERAQRMTPGLIRVAAPVAQVDDKIAEAATVDSKIAEAAIVAPVVILTVSGLTLASLVSGSHVWPSTFTVHRLHTAVVASLCCSCVPWADHSTSQPAMTVNFSHFADVATDASMSATIYCRHGSHTRTSNQYCSTISSQMLLCRVL